MQQTAEERVEKSKEIEQQNTYLLNRDLEIQATVQKLKSKYKQKLIEKQQEVDQVKVQFAELQQLFNSKIDELTHAQPSPDKAHFNSFGHPPPLQQPGTRASQECEYSDVNVGLDGRISSKFDLQYGGTRGEGSSQRVLRRQSQDDSSASPHKSE